MSSPDETVRKKYDRRVLIEIPESSQDKTFFAFVDSLIELSKHHYDGTFVHDLYYPLFLAEAGVLETHPVETEPHP